MVSVSIQRNEILLCQVAKKKPLRGFYHSNAKQLRARGPALARASLSGTPRCAPRFARVLALRSGVPFGDATQAVTRSKQPTANSREFCITLEYRKAAAAARVAAASVAFYIGSASLCLQFGMYLFNCAQLRSRSLLRCSCS